MMNEQELKQTIRTIPDFPSEGIMFRDITTLVKDKEAFHSLITMIADELRPLNIDIVVGPEARGFIFGAAVAYALGAGFVLARKKGKLPCDVKSVEYGLEYGSDCIEMHTDAIKEGQRVAIVDDLLATGGTTQAVARLINEFGATVEAAAFAIELCDLNGREKLDGIRVFSAITY